ncbi:MAG: glycosyl transferase family 2 [Opitutae bacterium]|nr:glycosyl transferase family 2 [Opitutae bacterium]
MLRVRILTHYSKTTTLSPSLSNHIGKKKEPRLKLSVIVSTYNNPLALARILENLKAGTKRPEEIHVAEDGSNEETQQVVKNFTQSINHHCQEDKGFRKAKILNRAVNACQGDYVVFLDGDCLPHKQFVNDHLAIAEKGYFVQGRRCFIEEDQVNPLLQGKTSLPRLMLSGKVSGLLKSFRLPKPIVKVNRDMYGLLGCNLGVWREDLLAVNGFDEDYEGWGREDSDLGARLYNHGLRRKMVYGRALVYHLNHPENKRDQLVENDRRLEATISSGKIRCNNGIVKATHEKKRHSSNLNTD